MRTWLRKQLLDYREGVRILASRDFLRAFTRFYSGPEITRRLDNWTSRFREQTGQDTDWDLERRRLKRSKDEAEREEPS